MDLKEYIKNKLDEFKVEQILKEKKEMDEAIADDTIFYTKAISFAHDTNSTIDECYDGRFAIKKGKVTQYVSKEELVKNYDSLLKIFEQEWN